MCTRSRFRPARQAVVDVLNKSVETQQAVADLLSKRTRKSAEKSGKRRTQNIESSEISALEKTLNQALFPPHKLLFRSFTNFLFIDVSLDCAWISSCTTL